MYRCCTRYCCLVLVIGLLFFGVAMGGCKGTTINPTEPIEDPTPDPDSPTPVPTETPTIPEADATPTPSSLSYDGYADTPDDPTIKTLETDGESYLVTLEYTGDIDWYKIDVPERTGILSIELAEIPAQSDFDIVAYDEDLLEFENGRSTQAGNASELLEIYEPGQLVYLQIYSYSGRGTATLTLTAEAEQKPEIEHLTYEDILSTYYPLYPRGSFSGLLERHVETKVVEDITCQGILSSLDGTLTIGMYAHVERNILTLTDYIDGWALAVFNGSVQNLDEMMITIQVSIFSRDLGFTVDAPPDMYTRGNQYLKSLTKDDVYYITETYGDLRGNSSADIRISSGVIGDLGTLLSHEIFSQEVIVDWRVRLPDGTRCSGDAEGAPIKDFETMNMSVPPRHHLDRIW